MGESFINHYNVEWCIDLGCFQLLENFPHIKIHIWVKYIVYCEIWIESAPSLWGFRRRVGFLRWRPFLGTVFKRLHCWPAAKSPSTPHKLEQSSSWKLQRDKNENTKPGNWNLTGPEISGFWNNDPIYPSRIIFYLTKTMFFIAQVQAPVEIGSKQLKWYHVIWYLVPGIFFENWTKLLMIWKILPSSLAATHGTYSWHLLQNHKSCLHQEQEKILSYFLLTTLIWMLWLWLDCV